MKTEYNKIVIEYIEDENVWVFSLRNRGRRCGSLKEAKDLIDKPVKEANTFKPIPVWVLEYSGSAPKKATITSLAIPSRYTLAGKEAWVTYEDGKRAKEDVQRLYASDEKTDAVMDALTKSVKEIGLLQARVHTLRCSLVHLDFSKSDV